MRIVLDTNVFVSGVFFSGPPHRILQAWRNEKIQLVLSPDIFEEYREVGAEIAGSYPGVDLGPVLDLLLVRAEIIVAPPLARPVCDDPADDKFLACAVAAGVRWIVSGDKHLRKVSPFQGIEVVSPRAFVDRHLSM